MAARQATYFETDFPITQCKNEEVGGGKQPRNTTYLYLQNIDGKWENWQPNDNLRRGHFHLKGRRVLWIIISNIQQYWWWCRSSWRSLQEIKYWNVARQNPIFSCIIHSQQAYILLISFLMLAYCSFTSFSSNTLILILCYTMHCLIFNMSTNKCTQ